MLTETDIRLEIDEALKNKGWKLSGSEKNVFTEQSSSAGRADYVLKPKDREKPLVIIEAKRRGKDLNEALKQAQRYAEQFSSPIAYASDGSTIKTIHLSNLKPLILNGEEIDEFVSETLALQFLNTNEYNTIGKQVINSRKELINVFSSANKELRKEGLQAGVERFSEFCNILFLKIFSEEEATRQDQGLELRIPKEFNWDYFKNKDGNELLSYVNDTVLRHFQGEYGTDIFAPLQIKNPLTLKRIIDNLDPLSLVDTNSDIKGDAFEYFLKAYLANQNKDLGEYFTPRHIVKTLVKLINPKFGETIYDPFCGTGGMLIEAFRHVYNKMPRNAKTLQQLRQDTIYGSEITKNARITKMNMILTGDGHNNIIRQDSLKNPSKRKYDVVITNMPFSLGNFDDYSGLYKLGNPNGNSLCIEHCFDAIDSSSENPRIGIIVSEGILFDKKFTKLREYMYQNSHVQNIVSLPSGAFKPYTDVKTSILYLTQVNQSKKKQKTIWHYTVQNDGYTLNTKRQKKDGENDLDIFLSFNDVDNESNLLHVGFNKLSMDEVEENSYISIPNPYKKFDFNSDFELVRLGELIEECTLRNHQNEAVWSVTNDRGFISSEEMFDERVASKNTENYKVILPNAFAYNPSRINVGSIAFNASQNSGCVSPMYVVFKIINENVLNPKYLHWLIQSDQFKNQINTFAFGSVRQTVNFDDFCKITIPLPKLDAQERIVEELESYKNVISGVTKVISNWRYDVDTISEKISLKDIATFEYGYTTMAYAKGDFRLIRITDINEFGLIKKEDKKYASLPGGSEKYILQDKDILVARTGATFGKVAIYEQGEEPAIFASYLIRIILDRELILPKYYWFFAQSDYYWLQARNLISGTGQPQFNANALEKIEVPLPSIDKQKEIVEKFEKEKNLIETQKNILAIFREKIASKLDMVWQSSNQDEPIADKSTFDMLISKASEPVQ